MDPECDGCHVVASSCRGREELFPTVSMAVPSRSRRSRNRRRALEVIAVIVIAVVVAVVPTRQGIRPYDEI